MPLPTAAREPSNVCVTGGSPTPTRLLLVYADRPADAERALDIRPADAGANVAILTPFDAVVYERTSTKNGVVIATLSQVAADLLTSPGRGPNEGDVLMQ